MEACAHLKAKLGSKVADMLRSSPSEGEISAAMEEIQKLAAIEPDAARLLMADLWPIASEAYMHDVCDSIDLWIADRPSPSLISKLKELADTHHNAAVRNHWLGLLSSV
jgi:hypothetical protein